MMLIDMPYTDYKEKEKDKVIEITSPDQVPVFLRKFKKE